MLHPVYLRIGSQTDPDAFARAMLDGIVDLLGATSAAFVSTVEGVAWRYYRGGDLIPETPPARRPHGITVIGHGTDMDAPFTEGPALYMFSPIERAGETLGWLYVYDVDRDDLSEIEQFCSFVGIVAENIRLYTAAREAAETDALTGIPNRRALEIAISQWVRVEQPFACVMFDINDFKAINDGPGGHAAGDRALQIIAFELDHHRRKGDVVGRYGGDEFIALLEGSKDIDQYTGRVFNSLKLHGISLSYGVSYYPKDADNIDQLKNIADAEMYVYKKTLKDNRTAKGEKSPTFAPRLELLTGTELGEKILAKVMGPAAIESLLQERSGESVPAARTEPIARPF